MGAVLTSIGKGMAQLGDPAVLRVLLKTVGLTLVVFGIVGFALYHALEAAFESAGLFAGFEATFLLTLAITAVALWLLFRIVALAILQFFADDIVQAVERKHYPAIAPLRRDLPFREEARHSLGGIARALVANGLALIVAIPLLLTAIGPAILFWAVNGWLLGRELQDMVWLRHRSTGEEVAPLGRLERFALGGAIAALMIVPFVNLLAPVIGAASATHLVHRRRQTDHVR